ncbi:rbsK [Symbiodinium pilosum]|uniref:RbsK protein n=1 Tax=Symbiodinium pilosum TaxID=2952 RepID=A0A812W0D3_SYMPI|nr:rbsK [Symbiodinium pilosum]
MTGDIFIDIVDSDVEAESVKMLPGGSALNQGRHLHALGTRVRFFGAVGDDTLGRSLLHQVAGQGFPTETIKMFSSLPSAVCVVLSGPVDRAFVSCYSTNDAFTTRDLHEQASELEACSHFHWGGYFNMKGLQSQDFTNFIRSCRANGMTISMNTQCDAAGHWCGEGNHLEEFLPLVDLLFVNISEGEHLCAALCHDGDHSMSALCKRYPTVTFARCLVWEVAQGRTSAWSDPRQAHARWSHKESMVALFIVRVCTPYMCQPSQPLASWMSQAVAMLSSPASYLLGWHTGQSLTPTPSTRPCSRHAPKAMPWPAYA